MKTTIASCRLTPDFGSVLDAAAAERGLLRSELLRSALRYYIANNPDGYQAFENVRGLEERSAEYPPEGEIWADSDPVRNRAIYDPTLGEF